MTALAISGVVALLITTGLSLLFFTMPLWWDTEEGWGWPMVTGTLGLLGVLSVGATLWSARHNKRMAGVGLVLALFYLAAVILFPWSLAPFIFFGGPALLVTGLAVANNLPRKHVERT